MGPRSHLRDDRASAGLGAVAPAAVGHADPGVLLQGVRHRARDADTMDHIAAIFTQHGADAWWTMSVAELVPPGTACKQLQVDRQLEKEKDIVDVWFESGVSWLAMERRRDGADYKHIDLYLEGSDQHRGWFHSSLLAGIGLMGRAPYKQVITHGFVLDEHGKEYSQERDRKGEGRGQEDELHRARQRDREVGRGDVPAVGRLDRVPQRHAVLAGAARRARRLVSQAAQHRAVPARQPQRLRSRCPPSWRAPADRRGDDPGDRRLRASLSRGLRALRAAQRASRARRVRHDRRVGAVLGHREGPAVFERDRLRRAAQRAVGAVECASAIASIVGADPVLHRRGHLEVSAAASRRARTAFTSRRSERTPSPTDARSRPGSS